MLRGGALQRPVGFKPWEISAMVNREVVDQHGIEAAFLWTQRDHAVTSPRYALKHLLKLDRRVEAHLDGLRVAGEIGWETCVAAIGNGPGEVFAAAVLAFGSGNEERIRTVLKAGCADPALERGLISALGWLPADRAIDAARQLLASEDPEIRRVAIAAHAIHRSNPGPAVARALGDSQPRLAARAARAAAELGQTDLSWEVSQRGSDPDLDCRFWSAWSAARLGERHPSVLNALRSIADAGGVYAQAAVEMELRCLPGADAKARCGELAKSRRKMRLAAIGYGAIGDPADIDVLIHMMQDPAMARAAGGSFSLITGADLGYEDLSGDAPKEAAPAEGDDAPVESDLDIGFEWPVPEKVARWWNRRKSGYQPGIRYVRGKPISDSALNDALVKGTQNQRAAGALDLALRHSSEILFETRARADVQIEKVSQWNS